MRYKVSCTTVLGKMQLAASVKSTHARKLFTVRCFGRPPAAAYCNFPGCLGHIDLEHLPVPTTLRGGVGPTHAGSRYGERLGILRGFCTFTWRTGSPARFRPCHPR